MQIITEKGDQMRGDLIVSAVVRYDLVPVPATFEGEIRVDETLRKQFAEGKIIEVNGDKFRIMKPCESSNRVSQGERDMRGVRITAFLDSCHAASFVRKKAIIKENARLTDIYRAAGSTIPPVVGDFKANRFACYAGETPTFHIARVLQEEGGVVRWRRGRLEFVRLGDLFKQQPVLALPDNANEDTQSEFLARHEVPSFYSIAPNGDVIFGNQQKARTAKFVPRKNQQQLINMSRCLITRKVARLSYRPRVMAGDLVEFYGREPMVVMTAAHVFQSGTDGSPADQYTRLWCGVLEA